MRGFFVTAEGVNGCGKSTQLGLLKESLEKKGYNVVVTKEPGASRIGPQIRKMLFQQDISRLAPGVVDMLFLAEHLQTVHDVIKPALSSGKIILCDRYADSNIAYQKVRETPRPAMTVYTEMYGVVPDLTILFTGNPTVMLARALKERERLGRVVEPWLSSAELSKIQLSYQMNLGRAQRVIQVEIGNKGISEVFQEVEKLVTKKILEKRIQVQ